MSSRRVVFLAIALVIMVAGNVFAQLQAPQELTVIRVNDDIQLRWDAVAGASGYNVYKDTDPEVDLSFPYTNVSTNTFTDIGTGPDEALYFYAVTAIIPSGTLTGAILDTNSVGFPGVLVEAVNQADASIQVRTYTQAAGNYTISDIPVGTYTVYVYKCRYPVYTTTAIITDGGTVTLNYEFVDFLWVPKTGILAGGDTWTNDNVYQLVGRVEVPAGQTLTIEPGTTIVGQYPLLGYLEIEQQGQIQAVGTKYKPIVFTSNRPAGTRADGDWGGVIISGRAHNNEGVGIAGEGNTGPHGNGPSTEFDTESSGTLRYLRLEFPGFRFSDTNELNGLCLQSVGSGTDISYVSVTRGQDDAIEWFGGTVNFHHGVFVNAGDDHFDWTSGAQFSAHHVLVITRGDASDRAIEADNLESSHNASPRSDVALSNLTLIGKRGNTNGDGSDLVTFRRGTVFHVFNTIWTLGRSRGFDIDDVATSIAAVNSDVDYNIFWANGGNMATLNAWTGGPEGDGHFGVEDVEWNIPLCVPATGWVENTVSMAAPVGWTQDLAGYRGCGITGTDATTLVTNPMLINVSSTITDPSLIDARPNLGSPALNPANAAPSGVVSPYGLPVTNYIGAFSGPTDDWMVGWTDLNP